ncbi:MAG: glycosyltransferase family 2 protein [Pseudomonadota bacterium]
MTEKTAAIIVSYLPEAEKLRALLLRLDRQVDKIFLVDNSPDGGQDIQRILSACTLVSSQVCLDSAGENRGLAAGLNTGIRAAIEAGYEYVLLSDQDSLPAEDMVQQLHVCRRQLDEEGDRVAAVGPRYSDLYTGYTYPFQVSSPSKTFHTHAHPSSEQLYLYTQSLITSGSLLPVAALLDIGLMREDFFIDFVDTEWCHRARAQGYVVVGSALAQMQQHMGDNVLRVWFLGWRNESAYSPLRIYYRVRNYCALLKLQHTDWRWKLRSGWYILGIVYANLTFNRAASPASYLVATLRGLWHGILGKMGAAATP